MGICLSAHIRGVPIVPHQERVVKIVASPMGTEQHSLTWDNDRRVRGVDPIIRPDINKILRYNVPLGSL